MTDSIVLDGLSINTRGDIEIQGYDFGEAAKNVLTIESLFGDGDVVTGRSSGNRRLRIPLLVRGSTRAAVVAKVDQLALIVDRERYTLEITPSGGSAYVFDCYRGNLTQAWDLLDEKQAIIQVVLDLPAAPFTRAPDPVTVSAGTSEVQFDTFDSGSWTFTSGASAAATQTTTKSKGTGALMVTTSGDGSTSITVTRTGLSSVAFDEATQTANVRAYNQASSAINVVLTLTSASGSLTFPYQTLGWSQWSELVFDNGVSAGSFNPAAVTGYTLTLTKQDGTQFLTGWVYYFDDGRFVAEGAGTAGLFTFSDPQGSARTPLAVELSRSASALTWAVVARWPARVPAYSPVATVGSNPCFAYRGQFAVVVEMSGTGHSAGTATVTFTQSLTSGGPSKVLVGAVAAGTRFNEVGFITLPLTDVSPNNTAATFTIGVTGVTPARVWLFDAEGEVLILGDGIEAVAPKRVFLDPADAATDTPRLLGSPGNLATRTDAVSLTPWMLGSMHPYLVPGEVNSLYVLTDGTLPTVSASYYPRWFGPRP